MYVRCIDNWLCPSTVFTMKIDWDPGKDQANVLKHGISFDEASSVFYDESAQLIDDPTHSEAEDRFIILGMSMKFRILVVCHCYRVDGEVIRIISARKANKPESKSYKDRYHA